MNSDKIYTPGAFYEVLPSTEAFSLAQSFETHYTPKKGGWLNMAEFEFAALSKQCLNRRIPDVKTLRQEVLAWAERRNQRRGVVNWTFTKHKTQEKLERHYNYINKLI